MIMSARIARLGSYLALMGWLALAQAAQAEQAQQTEEPDQKIIKTHGYSFYGDLSYPADYAHFDYVNPDAPKGGEISLAISGTFDTMNPYFRGGRPAPLSTIMYESLLGQQLAGSGSLPADQDDEMYGLLAESLEYPEDKSWVIFHMRPEAEFSDGTPLTAHDVLFSHNLFLDQGLESYAKAVRQRIPRAEVIDDHTIKFYFTDGISRRSLIDQVGTVPVFSQAWYEETGARLDQVRLETPPGSGPYMVDQIEPGRRLTFRRNPDYWGAHLPINQGRHNFDRIRLEFFADTTAAFEAFKSGSVTYRTEADPKRWAQSYNFPAVQAGKVKLEELEDGTPPTMSGIIFNLGRPALQDKRVRQAIALAFNFEWTNKSLLFGLYEQQSSYSTGTEMAATSPPTGAEKAFLESLETEVAEAIFGPPQPLVHDSDPDRLLSRDTMRKAAKLLDAAGWQVGDDGLRRNAEGKPLRITFLFNASSSGTDKPLVYSFIQNLKLLGLTAKLESVDSSQYTLRERDRDYDLVMDYYPPLYGTGTGLMQRFGSEAAAYSLFNPAGLADPLVDEIIQHSLRAETPEEEEMMIRALDRALREAFILIPTGYAPTNWVAYWDIYDHPEEMPKFSMGALDFWWYDADAAKNNKPGNG